MGVKVGTERIMRENGYLYYVDAGGMVVAAPMKHNTNGKKKTVGTAKVSKKKGYMYYLGKDGYVYEAMMKNSK